MTDYERLVLRMNIIGGIFQDMGCENVTENDLENIAKDSDRYKRFINDYMTYGIEWRIEHMFEPHPRKISAWQTPLKMIYLYYQRKRGNSYGITGNNY